MTANDGRPARKNKLTSSYVVVVFLYKFLSQRGGLLPCAVVVVDGFSHHERGGRRSSSTLLLHPKRLRSSPVECPVVVSVMSEAVGENDTTKLFVASPYKERGEQQRRSPWIRQPIHIHQQDNNNNTDGVDQSLVSPNWSEQLQAQLRSYSTYLLRARREQETIKNGEQRMTPLVAKSLFVFLKTNPLPAQLDDDGDDGIDLIGNTNKRDDGSHTSTTKKHQLQQGLIGCLERPLVQAIRLAGEYNDYNLIQQLISSSITFANNHPILTPQIFGEAIAGLSKTQANDAKIKSIWKLMMGSDETVGNHNNNDHHIIPPFLSAPPTSYELTRLLKALGRRGKYKACVDLYQQYSSSRIRNLPGGKSSRSVYIRPDVYSVSTLLSILTDSITTMSASQHHNGCDHSIIDFGAKAVSASSSSLHTKLTGLSSSICWQWNAALQILGSLEDVDKDDDGTIPATSATLTTHHKLNNHVYSSLVKLQSTAQDVYGMDGGHRNGPQMTMAILDHMLKNNVRLDVVTCALAIKAMGLLEKNESTFLTSRKRKDGSGNNNNNNMAIGGNTLAVDFLHQMKSDPRLPNPNEYCYSAAMTACARRKDHVTAIELLEEMRSSGGVVCSSSPQDGVGDDADNIGRWSNPSSSSSSPPPPTTWSYNAVFLSLCDYSPPSLLLGDSDEVIQQTSGRSKEKELHGRTGLQRLEETVLGLLEQMKQDHAQHNWSTLPDTTTYNTILGMKSLTLANNHNTSQSILNVLFDRMENEGIRRDTITYRQAILSSCNSDNVLNLLGKSLTDSYLIRPKDKRSSNSFNKMGYSLTNIFNTGLSFLASREDYITFMKVMVLMQEHSIPMNGETVSPLINVLGRSGKCDMLESLLEGLSGGDHHDATTTLQKLSDMGLPTVVGKDHPVIRLRDSHYTEAIEVCLLVNEFQYAHKILSLMRSQGIRPTNEFMECFALAYAEAATNAASKEGRSAVQDTTSKSWARANSAYKIVMALAQPRPKVLGRVACACAVTGQWKSARVVLRSIHNGLKSEMVNCPTTGHRSAWNNRQVVDSVKSIQSYLLRECAKQGNVEAALWYTRDIQDFAKALRRTSDGDDNHRLPPVSSSFAEVPLDDFFGNLRDYTSSTTTTRINIGMHPQDWVSLAQAASRADQWRVGINTLQFIRPFVERTNPQISGRDASIVDDRYEQLMPALTAVVLCLETQSQYAWAARVVEDWMTWSGRKPRTDAALSAIRVLSKNGQGEEVKRLLEHCINPGLGVCYNKKDIGYEEMLYIYAVTALHQNGLYDDADEVFMSGVSDGYVQFDFVKIHGNSTLDLHGLNVALAHSAVRVALRQHAAEFSDSVDASVMGDMMIITGMGKRSTFRLRPILRPEVQRMLMEEFYPPLNTWSVPGNLGALVVLASDVMAWQSHQEAQKGARMMDLAALLRNLSSPDRLKRSIALRMKASNEGGMMSDEETQQS